MSTGALPGGLGARGKRPRPGRRQRVAMANQLPGPTGPSRDPDRLEDERAYRAQDHCLRPGIRPDRRQAPGRPPGGAGAPNPRFARLAVTIPPAPVAMQLTSIRSTARMPIASLTLLEPR